MGSVRDEENSYRGLLPSSDDEEDALTVRETPRAPTPTSATQVRYSNLVLL